MSSPKMPVPPSRTSSSGLSIVLGCAIGAMVVTLVAFAPRFWLWPAVGMPLRDLISVQPELHRAYYALQQLQNPFQKIGSDVNRVIEWRLLWPLVGHYAGFPSRAYFALPFLGCVVTLGAAAAILWRASRDLRVTLGATLLVATSSWFFVSTGWLGYFDSWLIFALLLASFERSRWLLFITALLAPWVDERFILVLPLCLGVRALEPDCDAQKFRLYAKFLVAGVVPYIAIRLFAEVTGARSTSSSYWSQHGLIPAPLGGMLIGGWQGLRLGWIVAVGALALLAQRKHWLAFTAIAATFLVNVCVADDISRSTSAMIPVVLAGAIAWFRLGKFRPVLVLPLLGLGNLLLPAAHIIATPLSQTERYHTTPVRSLPAEREEARHPPSFANPEAYTERGMQAFAAGEFAIARGQFELALCFDPEFPRARAHRGILMFAEGRRQEGLGEMDRALSREPGMFDVRLQRATFRRQLGDLAGAAVDAQEAVRAMPADWPRRAEAEAFAKALAAAAAAK